MNHFALIGYELVAPDPINTAIAELQRDGKPNDQVRTLPDIRVVRALPPSGIHTRQFSWGVR